MKILLIGGTGNLSEECVTELEERGHELTLLTRGRREFAARHRCLHADYRDRDALEAALGTGEGPARCNGLIAR